MTPIAIAPTALPAAPAERVDGVSDASLVQWAKKLAEARRTPEAAAREGQPDPVQAQRSQGSSGVGVGAADGLGNSRQAAR